MTGICDLNSECYSVISIDKGNYISSIKVKDGDGDSWIKKDYINIYFNRPNPDATIIEEGSEYSRARITITDSAKSYIRCIEIGAAGDISIKSNCS